MSLQDEFFEEFFGYGAWRAPVWFVGMGEGGESDAERQRRRIHAWDERGRRELEDLADYHRAIGITRHFDERARLQLTWAKLIRVLFAMQGRNADRESVRQYQATRLGCFDGETALVELDARRSSAYSRAARLRQCVGEHQPSTVVFYGLTNLRWWLEIAGVPLPTDQCVASGATAFIAMKHPNARGVTNAYFSEIGRSIASRNSRNSSTTRPAGNAREMLQKIA